MKNTAVASCVLALVFISTLLFVDGMVVVFNLPTASPVIHNYDQFYSDHRSTIITENRDVLRISHLLTTLIF